MARLIPDPEEGLSGDALARKKYRKAIVIVRGSCR
jgi:hypothetical protein